MLRWAPGAATPLHGHPDGGCYMTVLTRGGGLAEEDAQGRRRQLRCGALGFRRGSGPAGLNRVTFAPAATAATLHVYLGRD